MIIPLVIEDIINKYIIELNHIENNKKLLKEIKKKIYKRPDIINEKIYDDFIVDFSYYFIKYKKYNHNYRAYSYFWRIYGY